MRNWKPATDHVHVDSVEVERLADCAEKNWWSDLDGGDVDPSPWSATGDALVMVSGGTITVYRAEKTFDVGYRRRDDA
jgi:hypothetical protein